MLALDIHPVVVYHMSALISLYGMNTERLTSKLASDAIAAMV